MNNGECSDDLSTSDAAGDDCTWYEDDTFCGEYDDFEFSSYEQCCACGGGGAVVDGDCASDFSTSDAFGDDCSWYQENPLGCGEYDDFEFSAYDQCCACGGGY